MSEPYGIARAGDPFPERCAEEARTFIQSFIPADETSESSDAKCDRRCRFGAGMDNASRPC